MLSMQCVTYCYVVLPNLFNAPTTYPTPPELMKSFLADCLLASMERAGQAISQTPKSQIVDVERVTIN